MAMKMGMEMIKKENKASLHQENIVKVIEVLPINRIVNKIVSKYHSHNR